MHSRAAFRFYRNSRLENYKSQIRPLIVRLQCTVRFVLVYADCALSLVEPRSTSVLVPGRYRSLTHCQPPEQLLLLQSSVCSPPPLFRAVDLPPQLLLSDPHKAGLLVQLANKLTDCQISPMSPEEEGLSSTFTDWLFINSWWLLLPFIMLLVVAAFIVAFVLLLYMISPLISPKPLKLNGAHVVVSAPKC